MQALECSSNVWMGRIFQLKEGSESHEVSVVGGVLLMGQPRSSRGTHLPPVGHSLETIRISSHAGSLAVEHLFLEAGGLLYFPAPLFFKCTLLASPSRLECCLL